ncbi:MAG: response regulator transcription factor [Gammaproteobacteria bacterium]|nr:response regulator transcription factor [Gammaproteobacteria bacterium]
MRVLIIEDHHDIAANIGDYLEPKGYSVDFAADGVTGLHLALTETYDVIVLDLNLPAMDGIELCRKLRQDGKRDTPVLMLTARDQLDQKVEGFGAGADDYLVKPFAMKELEIRLQALHRRATSQRGGRVLKVSDLEFDPETLVVKRGGKRVDLNPTMRTLLELLMRQSPRVVSRNDLEYAVWGDDRPDGDVLRAHIHSLRAAIDKPFETRLLHTVHGTGYRLANDDATAHGG